MVYVQELDSQGFADRQKQTRKAIANRPAVRNVPRRDDWSTINTPDDRFGQYAQRVADQARYKYEAPQRAWDNMTNSHRVALAGGLDAAGEKQFKQDRRDWNRKFKYTPVGMKASGVTTPSDAVDLYYDMSSHLAFDSPKLMDRMYPFSRGIGRLFNAAIENIGPIGWLNRMIPKRDPIVPENVLAMRDRFSPADILKGDIASYPIEPEFEEEIIGDIPLGAVDRSANWFYPHDVGLEDVSIMNLPNEESFTDIGIEDDYVDLDEVYEWSESGKQLQEGGKTITGLVNEIMDPLGPNYDGGWDRDELIEAMIHRNYIQKKE